MTKKTEIFPLYERVLVEPHPQEEEHVINGVCIPYTAQPTSNAATVVAVGFKKLEDGSHQELTVKVGDQVLCPAHTGRPLNIDGKELLILNESDILAIIKVN